VARGLTTGSPWVYTPHLVVVEKTDEGRSRGPEQRPAAKEERPKRTDLGKVGRRAAAVVYAVLALWIGGAAMWSVVPQIFWPGAGAQFEEQDCSAALAGLRSEIIDAAGACVAETTDLAAFRSALTGFDGRYHALSTACGDAPGYGELLAFRYALATQIERYATEVRPLSERARASIHH
jgi:hypothetical protein